MEKVMRCHHQVLLQPDRLRSLKLVLFIFCATILFQGCKKDGLFFTAGETRLVTVKLTSFSEVQLYDKVNLVLTYDSIESVSVEAGENLLTGVSANVTDGKLVIHDNNKMKWARDLDYSITVYVHSRSLNRLTYFGAGDVRTTNTWKGDELYVDSWTGIGTIDLDIECGYAELFIRMANANFRIRGSSPRTRMYCADYGSMDLSGFATELMNLDYRSIRNSTINVTRLLSAKLLYKGNVYYYGNPQLDVDNQSSGQLIHLP